MNQTIKVLLQKLDHSSVSRPSDLQKLPRGTLPGLPEKIEVLVEAEKLLEKVAGNKLTLAVAPWE